AIIQNGSLRNEKIAVGTVNTIAQIYQEKQLSNPAIIVLGHVVNHRDQMLQIAQQVETQPSNY
ncbi:MAG: uroporphyrinogen-III C-methyltransferase, partial [Bacteroidota bacterium]|nr:uroporphyrinogen-III C-methyltransferase [Bacteroidota bacterium]